MLQSYSAIIEMLLTCGRGRDDTEWERSPPIKYGGAIPLDVSRRCLNP